jgi:HSP20 family protein
MTALLEPMVEFDRMINRMLSINGVRSAFFPDADVVVTDDEVMVQMDLPGLSADDIVIELENDVLSVRGERNYPYDDGDDAKTWRRVERGFGRFERTLRVPRGLDPDAIEAELTQGVLTIRMPKPDELKPHRVEINAVGEERQLVAA